MIHLLTSANRVLKYQKMDQSSLRLQVFSNATYGNNFEGSSELLYFYFLGHIPDTYQPFC